MLTYLIAFPLGAALAWMCSWVELRGWRKSANAHWTERARALYPARIAARLNLVFIPGIVALWAYHYHPQASWVATGLLCYLGGLVGLYPMEFQLFPELKGRRWFHLAAATIVMRVLRWLTLIVCAAAMPQQFGWASVAVFLAYAGVLVGLQMGCGLALLRLMRVLGPPSSRLQALAAETAVRVGVTPRKVWELQSPMAGAFAVVTSRELLFTTKLLEVAPDDEIKTVCAHELGHLSESRWVVMTRIVSGWVLVPAIFVRPIEYRFGSGGIAVLALLGLFMWMAVSRLSRAMEKRADKIASAAADEGPVYARALERIYRTNHMPAVTRSRALATHPDLYDRMIAAKVTPEYPRPQPPNVYPITAMAFQVVLMIAILANA